MDTITTNIFEYYFQQPAEITIDEVSKASNVISRSSNDIRFMRKDYSQISDYYEWNQEYFQELAAMQRKYIHLKNNVEERMTADIDSMGLTGRTIGVHIRRLMLQYHVKDHPVAVDLDDFVNAVKKLIETGRYDQIFLATEEMESLERMQQEFGDRLVYYKDIYRNNIGDTYRSAVSDRKEHHYLLGYEVLRDVYTLANCQALVAGLSNISFCAKIKRLSTETDYMDEIILNNGLAKDGMGFNTFYKKSEKRINNE